MADIYQIDSNDIIDRVSVFGNTNLALGTDYSNITNCASVTFLDNNRVKIPAGVSFSTANSKTNYDSTITVSNYHFHVPIYENTLDDKATFTAWRRDPNGTGATGNNDIVASGVTEEWNHSYPGPHTVRGFYFAVSTTASTTGYITIGPLKVERGNKSTDWTPSPYDLVTVSDTTLDIF